MSLETTLKDICACLTSERATERKKNAENLKTFLTGNAAPALLSENSLKKNGYCWNNLFKDINEYILKEYEKSHSLKSFETQAKPLATSLLHMVISGANKGKAYIKCEALTDSCLLILRDKQMFKAFGDAYLSLLYKYVFTNEHYFGHLSPKVWEEILQVTLAACSNKHSNLDYFTRIRLVFLIMQKGKDYCRFAVPIRDALPMLEKLYLNSDTVKKVQEVLIDIINVLLAVLTVEFRFTLCEFVESVMPSLLKYYDQNTENKKKTELFRALTLIVELHHPEGRLPRQQGCYAHNWNTWNRQLHNLLELVASESIFLEKESTSKFRHKTDIHKDYAEFFVLSALVYHQYFHIEKENNDPAATSDSKRQRVTLNKIQNFTDIIMEMTRNHCPWFGIITAYIRNYKKSISLEDQTLLISAIEKHVSTYKENSCWILIEDVMKCLTHFYDSTTNINSIWNACVRESLGANETSTAVHGILQHFINEKKVKDELLNPLLEIYSEGAMRVTNSSVQTLQSIMTLRFTSISVAEKNLFMKWLLPKEITAQPQLLSSLLLQLIAKDNINVMNKTEDKNYLWDDILFKNNSSCLLFTAFKFGCRRPMNIESRDLEPYWNHPPPKYDVNKEIYEKLNRIIIERLNEICNNVTGCKLTLFQNYVNFLNVVIEYCNNLLTNYSEDSLQDYGLFEAFKKAFFRTLCYLNRSLSSERTLEDYLQVLKVIKNILVKKYHQSWDKNIRSWIASDFFQALHGIINRKMNKNLDDDTDIQAESPKHACILLLAAYCKTTTEYTREILEFIFEPTVYNFACPLDVDCAFECMEILTDKDISQPPIDSIFALLQNMCKTLFRSPEATRRILKLLLLIMDKLWELPSPATRENCYIIIKVYLDRCEKSFYPPNVAVLVYDCISKIHSLNQKHNIFCDNNYEGALVSAAKCETHAMRLHCSYLMQDVVNKYSHKDVADFVKDALELFTVTVSNGNKTILKDELFNRTSSYLHLMYALALAKKSCIKLIIKSIIKVQVTKSLNKALVTEVLTLIPAIEASSTQNIGDYWSKDVLGLLHFWYSSGYTTEELPPYLVHNNINKFMQDHINWVIPAEALWCMGGNIESSTVLQKFSLLENNDKESVIGQCFCNTLILCLPYIVIEKYNIHLQDITSQPTFARTSQSAKKLFQSMRTILGNAKWNKLFIDSIIEMILLTALHLHDYKECKKTFNLKAQELVEDYYYSERVYIAILKYFGELISKDIMHFLCEHQPMGISKTLVMLWERVISCHRLESTCIALYAYIKFIESVPLGYPSDSFVATFACRSLLNVIEESHHEETLKVYAIALKIIIARFRTLKADILEDVIPNVILTLMTKKDESVEECNVLLDYLLSEIGDQTDGIAALSQNSTKTSKSNSAKEFCVILKFYLTSLSRPSYEILNNLKKFLKMNKNYIIKMWASLNLKGFSEECKISLLHTLTNSLIKIISSASESRGAPTDKLIIEATDCLSILGTYDLKTLVMSPPVDSKLISDLKPPQYFAIRIIEWLSNLLLHSNPEVVRNVMVTLTHMLKYREGKIALELGEVNVNIMKPLQPLKSNNVHASFQLADLPETRLPNLWLLGETETDCQWFQKIVKIYLDEIHSNFIINLSEVCNKLIKISPKIIPPIIGLVLYIRRDILFDKMSEQLKHFLEVLWTRTYISSSSHNSPVQGSPSNVSVSHDYQKVIQTVIEVIDFIRLQKNNYTHSSEEIETYNYLNLNYGKVAWAAAVSGNHFAGLYYGELWAMAKNKGFPPKSPEETMMLPDCEDLQSIFRRCYSSIGETDAIEGCGSGHLRNEAEKRKHLINTGQYSDALLVHDVAMSYDADARNDDQLRLGVIQALYKSGMHHLALQYMKTLPENEVPKNIKYDCLSLLGDWSVFVDTQELTRKPLHFNINITSHLKELRYACLKGCLTLEPTAHEKLELLLNTAKKTVTKLCEKVNMDNCQNVYSVISHLQLFGDIESYFAVRCSENSIKDLLDAWKVDKIAPYQDFKHIEPLLSQRSLLLDHAAKTFEFFKKDVMNLQLSYCDLALSNKQVQLAQRLLAVAKKYHSAAEVSFVEGIISWEKGHKDISLALVRDVMFHDDGQDAVLTATAFRQYGTWMAETRMENARDIIDKYLIKSLEVLNTDFRHDIRLKVYCDIAKYADAEYKQVVSYMKSSIFENKVKCLETMKGAASSLRSTQQTLNKDEKKAMVTNEKLSVLDEADINSTISEKRRFLETAMRFYLLSLQQGETNNLAVFRVTSLWIDNPQFEFERIEDNFQELLQGVPSRKFVPVLPQLAPRLTLSDEPFAKKLNEIIARCAKEHPFHTLPVLFGLKNSDQDKTIMNASASLSKPKPRTSVGGKDEARIVAAKALLLQVASDDRYAAMLDQMGKMCDALISFANFVSKSRDPKQEVPRSEPLCSLGPLPNVPIPTITLQVRADCNYTDVPGIQSFMNTFELVGGVNCPKKILCLGTNGIRRTTLIKGEDDLRQDAVMQQVFNIVNTLLELDPVTSKNRLLIRTYKVVALSRRSGVLEWCEGTMPIGTYLVGSNHNVGAHRKYRPKDISCQAARTKLQSYHDRGRSSADKLTVFLNILRELKPVFHYFFTEHYLDPVSWYERRLAYTKSVATSSMIGYIMGLGDRHVQNILIDKNTAEVVHIDFGIAFDQGKALPTPETIPFRLTQDVIAGFGSSGVEGIFRRSCEKTLQLLRDNHEALLTILEVLLCDPLYTWTISPAEAKRKQNLTATPRDTANASSSTSGLAERALLAVASKLNGTEGGATGGVAVSGQVARLIRCATDPSNLCRLYPGWQPYL